MYFSETGFSTPTFTLAEFRAAQWERAKTQDFLEGERRRGGLDASRQALSLLADPAGIEFDASGLPIYVADVTARAEHEMTHFRKTIDS